MFVRFLCAGILSLAASVCLADALSDEWTYTGEFHKAILAADRIVVRESFMDKIQTFEVKDPRDINEISQHIQFQSPQVPDSCLCSRGLVAIDWYKGGERIAATTVKHGVALQWDGFVADTRFTRESSVWLAAWLANHGITEPKESQEAIALEEALEEDAEREASKAMVLQKAVEREARPILDKFVPVGYLDALKRAEEKLAATTEGVSDSSSRKKLKDKYIRAVFKDEKAMYIALFRLMGCLPMRWDSCYEPEQNEAYEFLIRAPVAELDQAIQSASRSQDAEERQGAARIVFSEMYMTKYEKTDDDISRWMTWLAEVAYADPFPENRRLVLHKLKKHRDVPALAVLEQATSDPDQTVRQRALQAIAIRGGHEANQILRRVADGKVQPRVAPPLPTDYGKGTSESFPTKEMDEENCSCFTDQRLAELLIKQDD